MRFDTIAVWGRRSWVFVLVCQTCVTESFQYTPGPQSQWPDLVLPGVQKTVPSCSGTSSVGYTDRQSDNTRNRKTHIFENVTLASIVQFTTLLRTARVRDGSYEYEYEIVDDPDASTLKFC